MKRYAMCILAGMMALTAFAQAPDPAAQGLSAEVATHGWLAYSARTDAGDWDLFVCRPNGEGIRNITNSPDTEEAAPRFSPDGKKLLYRQFAKGTEINHDQWGFQGIAIVADANGTNPVALGGDGEFPWASWMPDGKQVVCLAKSGILIYDLATKQQVKKLSRAGIYQQLFVSPDGQWFTGTGNFQGTTWTVVRLNANTGELNAVRINQNCTPDWAPDSKQIIFSSRPADQTSNKGYGYTQLWIADGDGNNAKLLFGEDGFHIYGGTVSPDGKYVLFTKSPRDGGASEKGGAPIFLMRLSDAPIIQGDSPDLRKVHPTTNAGPVVALPVGWEPTWTLNEIGF